MKLPGISDRSNNKIKERRRGHIADDQTIILIKRYSFNTN